LSGLAKGFAVCDHWFASAPTQTLPNRGFAAAATSQGHLNNATSKFFTCQSIFGLLSQHNLDWAIYGHNQDPMTRKDYNDTLTAAAQHFGHFRDFQARAAAGTLPPYTFLEPDFGASGNSQHPNFNVAVGELLIHDVYYALRNGKGWNETLLLITYDEHGGNYDHVPPPYGATPPDNSVGQFGFDFKRFGVRIPAVLVSPLIAAGTVFRAKQGTIDHTSVLKTIEVRWGLPSLTERDKAAPDLGDVLTLAAPRADDPIKGVAVPVSKQAHPNQSQPSVLEKLHAEKVANLPLRNTQGVYDHHTPPELSTSAALNDYIHSRTAAWSEHLQRRQDRREARTAAHPPGTVRTKPAGRKKDKKP
jgi:phospholipase C